jgi:putative tricarboxylic transport membrane protein
MLAAGVVYEIMALYMPRGNIAYPGPGFFPMVVGVFLIATALGCLFQEILKRKTDDRQPGSPSAGKAASIESHFGKTFQLMALMIGYILALTPLGFPITISIFLVISIRIFGSRRWVSALAMAVIIATISYVSFVLWLKVPLPLGILEEVLG